MRQAPIFALGLLFVVGRGTPPPRWRGDPLARRQAAIPTAPARQPPTAAAHTQALSLREYSARLAGWEQAVAGVHSPGAAGQLASAVPQSLQVAPRDGGAPVLVSLAWLHQTLQALATAPWNRASAPARQHLRDAAQFRLSLLRREARAAATQGTLAGPAGEARLAAILARPGFHQAPSLWDQVWAAVGYVVGRVVSWLVRYVASNPGTSWAVALIILGAGLALVLLTSSRRRRRAPLPSAEPAPGWEQAWQRARDAAGRQDWRAVPELAYRAGLEMLAARGAWQMERSRTPREYLRMLTEGDPRRRDWRGLVRTLEDVCYAGLPATAAQAAEALARVENLARVSEAAP